MERFLRTVRFLGAAALGLMAAFVKLYSPAPEHIGSWFTAFAIVSFATVVVFAVEEILSRRSQRRRDEARERELTEQRQANALLRDKLETHDKFFSVIGGMTAQSSQGITALLGQQGADALKAELDVQKRLADLVVVGVDVPPRAPESSPWTYKLKAYVTVRNDTGIPIIVRVPSDWTGVPLFAPKGAPRIASSLQPMEGGNPGAEAQQLEVRAGGSFRFWLGFDPELKEDHLRHLAADGHLGRFTLPIRLGRRANDSEVEWARTI